MTKSIEISPEQSPNESLNDQKLSKVLNQGGNNTDDILELIQTGATQFDYSSSKILLLIPSICLLMFVPYFIVIIALTLVYEGIVIFAKEFTVIKKILYVFFSSCEELGRVILLNHLDQEFVPWLIGLGICIPAMFGTCFYLQVYYFENFSIPMMVLYHVLLMGPRFRNFAHFSVLVHKESHYLHGIYKYGFLNDVFGWLLGPFYGTPPEQYTMGHVKDHHKYTGKDLINVTDYDRTSKIDFVLFITRFAWAWTGIAHAIRFYTQGNYYFCYRISIGALAYFSAFAALYYFHPMFALTYYLLLLIFDIVFLSAINWTWHGFHDADDPENEYINSTTFLDGSDNIFNEDFHVAHHFVHTMHWVDMKLHYLKNVDKFRDNQATIFRGVQQLELFFYMFLNKFDILAEKFVDLSGKLTHKEKVALIKKRMAKDNN